MGKPGPGQEMNRVQTVAKDHVANDVLSRENSSDYKGARFRLMKDPGWLQLLTE